MAAVPEFPLLWNSFSMPQFEVGDDANLSLNVDGKGAHLRGLSGQSLSPSHRADLPFPLRSAVTADDYRRHGGISADGAALPLLAGDLHRGVFVDLVWMGLWGQMLMRSCLSA